MMEPDRQTSAARRAAELAAILRRSLQEQVQCAREGNLSRLEELSVSADATAAEIVQCGGLASAGLDGLRQDIERLYRELTLALTAERSETEVRLKQLRRVRRAVGVYGGTRRA